MFPDLKHLLYFDISFPILYLKVGPSSNVNGKLLVFRKLANL